MKTFKLVVAILLACIALWAMGQKPVSATTGATEVVETPATPNAELLETYWRLTKVADTEIDLTAQLARPFSPSEAHLFLKKENNMVNGSGGVNRFVSKYTLGENNALSVAPAGATLKAGLPEVMEIETKFFQALSKTKKYSIQGQTLTLLDEKDNSLAVFATFD